MDGLEFIGRTLIVALDRIGAVFGIVESYTVTHFDDLVSAIGRRPIGSVVVAMRFWLLQRVVLLLVLALLLLKAMRKVIRCWERGETES